MDENQNTNNTQVQSSQSPTNVQPNTQSQIPPNQQPQPPQTGQVIPQTISATPNKQKKGKLKWILIPIVILILIVGGYFIYKRLNTVRFEKMEASMLYVPQGYSVAKVDIPNERKTIWTTSFENADTNTKIVVGRFKEMDWQCPSQGQVVNGLNYCLVQLDPDSVIKQSMRWNNSGLTFEMTTSDENITFDELLKVAEPFNQNLIIPSTL